VAGFEDEGDDEDENEAPHEWRPMGVFKAMSVDCTNRANIGCHFQGTALHRPTQA
jgi:hypothetical protein